MVIKYRVKGVRGRLREFDPSLTYKNIMQNINKAQQNLLKIVEKSSGVRGEKYFGSETSLPDWVSETLDVLELADVRQPSISEIKQAIMLEKGIKQLASRYQAVQSRGLTPVLEAGYLQELEGLDGDDRFINAQRLMIEQKLAGLTQVQKQVFFTSKFYQEVKTAKGNYERILKWAEADSGENLTIDEAWAYMLNNKLSQYIAGL